MRIIYFGLSCFMLTLLIACGQVPYSDGDPAWAKPSEGGKVLLQQAVTIPGGWARVFLQRGGVVGYRELDRYHPSCNFELATVDANPRTLPAGQFAVIRIYRQEEEIVQRWPRRFAGKLLSNSADPPMIMHVLHFKLNSLQQPEVTRLSCRGALQEPAWARQPNMEEIRGALGDIARLEFPKI